LVSGREEFGYQKSEKLTCFCPNRSWPQIQHSMTTRDQMTISGALFINLLIHWELVKWICRLFLGHLTIGREDCGSEVWKPHLFCPSKSHCDLSN
jgi:hypothetical protein